jgi:hypothetical protein
VTWWLRPACLGAFQRVQAVKHDLGRFPAVFMLQLVGEESAQPQPPDPLPPSGEGGTAIRIRMYERQGACNAPLPRIRVYVPLPSRIFMPLLLLLVLPLGARPDGSMQRGARP